MIHNHKKSCNTHFDRDGGNPMHGFFMASKRRQACQEENVKQIVTNIANNKEKII